MGRFGYLFAGCAILAAGCAGLLHPEDPVVVDLRHDYRDCHVHDRPLMEDLQPVAWETRQVFFCRA